MEATNAAEQVNTVIDKLAEKLGIAVEQVKPLAETVIREYQLQSIAGAVACGILVVIGLLTLRWFAHSIRKVLKEAPEGFGRNEDATSMGQDVRIFLSVVGSIVMVIFSFACSWWIVRFVRQACAPTYFCLLELLK